MSGTPIDDERPAASGGPVTLDSLSDRPWESSGATAEAVQIATLGGDTVTVGFPPGGIAAGTRPGVAELFVTFLVIGVSAFGMAMMQAIRSTPVKRGWTSREEIDEGFGLVQLYPGATMVDLVTYFGYRMHRVRGALAAVAGFVTPSLVLLLVLSWAYVTYGANPGVRNLVVGLDALAVGVPVHGAADFGAQHARKSLSIWWRSAHLCLASRVRPFCGRCSAASFWMPSSCGCRSPHPRPRPRQVPNHIGA